MNLRRVGIVLGTFLLLCLSLILIFSAGFTAKAAGDAPSWGFSMSNLDKSCKPCDNFYQFAMGGWMKSNPIPPEYATWGSFTVVADRNQSSMRGIVEDAAKANAPANSIQQKIGDFYASCMDTAT